MDHVPKLEEVLNEEYFKSDLPHVIVEAYNSQSITELFERGFDADSSFVSIMERFREEAFNRRGTLLLKLNQK